MFIRDLGRKVCKSIDDEEEHKKKLDKLLAFDNKNKYIAKVVIMNPIRYAAFCQRGMRLFIII